MQQQAPRAALPTSGSGEAGSVAGRRPELVVAGGADERVSRQLHAIDAWNAYFREQEQRLTDPRSSREEALNARFEVESLRRTHAALLERVALTLSSAGDPTAQAPTVVICHRSPWFADRVRDCLEHRDMRVLECTDNGATALGVTIAEQPDLLLLSDRLVMVTGEQLVSQTAWYSPRTRRVVHAEESPDLAVRQAELSVLGARLRPEEVAEALLRLAGEQISLSAALDDAGASGRASSRQSRRQQPVRHSR